MSTCAQHEADLQAALARVRELETTVSQHESAAQALRSRLAEETATNTRHAIARQDAGNALHAAAGALQRGPTLRRR
jgi:predicted  nucleic acid-binding Zn-ribbon protein